MKITNPFKNKVYDFSTESFFIMYLNIFQIIQEVDLQQYAQSQETFSSKIPCNIYFILRRPKVTVDIESVKIKGSKVYFDTLIQDKSKFIPISIKLEFSKAKLPISFKCEYPYNLFTITDSDSHLLTAKPGTFLDESYTEKNLEIPLLDYEILYIGQAYGKNGERTAIERLMSHSTLQKIYSQSLSYNPDSDISILLTNFSQLDLLSVNGLAKSNPKNKEDDDKRAFEFFKNNGTLFSENQKINFTEAALIKYFQPKYNLEFKDSFPSKNHKSYSECYDLNIKSMAIELDTSESQRKIYTETSGKKTRHYMDFSFDTREDRFNLLNMIE